MNYCDNYNCCFILGRVCQGKGYFTPEYCDDHYINNDIREEENEGDDDSCK
jgi:hypothetical protein